jgi:hypothetical protein
VDKCPHCKKAESWGHKLYKCGTDTNVEATGRIRRSAPCYEAELATKTALLAECREVVEEVYNSKDGGAGSDGHYYYVALGKVVVNKTAALLPRLEAVLGTCCGGLILSDDHTHWTCVNCGKEWPMLVTPVEKKEKP